MVAFLAAGVQYHTVREERFLCLTVLWRSAGVEKARRQEHEAAGHMAATVKKQRESVLVRVLLL